MSHIRIGQKLAHYEILAKIGEGGMGEVYRARDTKLGREIALKVLPPGFATNRSRRTRFEREAKAVAALNHPNIITLHAIEEANDVRFITMELVQGRTLDQVIHEASHPAQKSGVALQEFLDLAIPIVDAIAAAHDEGIAHRDLKPNNILVTKDGRPKVLDFGLAKQLSGTENFGADEDTAVQTGEGVIVGTVVYMSPEQALGEEVDGRSDIFSLGIVFYEMLTGRRPFDGNSSTQIIDKIVHAEPPPIEFADGNTSMELVHIVTKCMQKDRERRYQSARDLRIDLDNLRSSGSRSQAATMIRPAPPKPVRRPWLAIGALIFAIAVVAIAFVMTRGGKEAAPLESVAVLPFSNDTGDVDNDYLSEGIAESVINSLSQQGDLTVISRTSAFRFDESSSLEEIGSKLGVDAVVLGHIARRGDQLRISAELVAIPEGRQLWGESFNRSTVDLLQLESELAGTIATNLRGRVAAQGGTPLLGPIDVAASRHPQNPDAYQEYLRARLFFTRTSSDMAKAVELLDRALTIDPDYALAWAMRAEITTIQAVYGLTDPTEAIAATRRAAEKAVALDPSLPEALVASGMVKFYLDWDWNGAEREYKRAIELNPGSPAAYVEYSELLFAIGRGADAVEMSKKVVPLDPLSSRGPHGQGIGYLLLGDYEKAAAMFQKALETNPSWTWGYVKKGKALAHAGQCEESRRFVELADQRLAGGIDPLAQSWLGGSLAICGDIEGAQAKLALIEGYETEWFVDPVIPAGIHAALGDKDEVIRLFELAYQRRSPLMAYVRIMPNLWLPELADDPRFQKILTTIERRQS